jgi:hypothetical protein
MRAEAICTIGYEGGTIDAFIRTLRQAKVELVLDIRAAPLSRKLATHLSEAGIGYRHLRGLGTPKRGWEARAASLRKLRAHFSCASPARSRVAIALAQGVQCQES